MQHCQDDGITVPREYRDAEGVRVPGCWKNHTAGWSGTGFSPTDTLDNNLGCPL